MDNSFRVVAVISAFNEADIISPVIHHLVENGIDVYLMDNHSTDDTVQQAARWLGKGLFDIEQFPQSSADAGKFEWAAILRRKEELANTFQANWFIHHDADEIRDSPWPGLTLKESIRWVDKLGYNCIDFRLLNFPPIDDEFKRGDDPRTYFRFYEEGAECDKVQLKCWKAGKTRVSLAPHGGHEARFQGRRVFPMQFLLRHYPIRGQTHGLKKVFAERRNRLLQAEKSQGWHRQYDQIIDERHVFLRNPVELRRFDLDQARLELMLPEKILRDLADRVVMGDQEISSLQSHRLELMKHAGNLEKERDELESHAGNLEREQEELKSHASNLERERGELRKQAANLEKERDELESHAGNLEREQEELKSHASNLERERGELRKQAANLEKERDELKSHAADVEKERDELRRHGGNWEQEREELRQHATNVERERDSIRMDAEHMETLRQDLERSNYALQQEMTAIRNSRSWRWTAPLRRLFDMLKV